MVVARSLGVFKMKADYIEVPSNLLSYGGQPAVTLQVREDGRVGVYSRALGWQIVNVEDLPKQYAKLVARAAILSDK